MWATDATPGGLRVVRWLWIPLAIAGIAMTVYGVHLGRYDIVEQQAQALCTSCIGLTLE